MSTNDDRRPSLDAIVDAIRRDEPSHAEIETAAGRVREALGFDAPAVAGSTLHIESCAGFQALIPDFLAGRLEHSAMVLVEDHSRECIPCRRALIAARTPKADPAVAETRRRTPVLAWAATAAAAAIVVVAGYTAWQVLPGFAAAPKLKVMRVEGALVQLRRGEIVPLAAGMTVSAADPVRTGRDSGAVLQMDDGSRIELRDRTELSVRRQRRGSTVALGNGSIIVEASPQGSGHLDVRTDDCLVSVKGTIFAVNRGTKGSRVSVVEGSVRVDTGGSERTLRPGEQVASTEAVAAVPVEQEIAWSLDAPRYGQLLKELAALRQSLVARVPNPKLRYSSTLLDRVPADTVLYAAIPNLTDALVEARAVVLERVAASPQLQAWWNQNMNSPEAQKEFDQAFEHARALGSQLGDEIVITLSLGPDGKPFGPSIRANVKDPDGFRRLLDEHMGTVAHDVAVAFDGPVVTLGPRPDPSAVRVAPAGVLTGTFHDKIAGAYADGATWVFGVDLKTILAAERIAHPDQTRGSAVLDRAGILDAHYIIASRADEASAATNRAEITFDRARRGLAAWLETPAPLGALDFVSPDATLAAAAVIRRPELMLADALSWLAPEATGIGAPMPEADQQQILDDLRDLAGALEGDVAVAIDGPILPTPSWKIAIGVSDPARAQAAVERLVGLINDGTARAGTAARIVLATEDAGNRIDRVLRFTGGTTGESYEVHYTFGDGYLVAAPTRALLDLTLEQHANGYRLSGSPAFTEILPKDGHVDVSALFWRHTGPALDPILSKVSAAVAPSARSQIAQLLGGDRPSVMTAYADGDRILIASHDEAGLGAMIGTIVSLNTLSRLEGALTDARQPHHEETPTAK